MLVDRLGRQPTDGELYIAHFLGPAGATQLIATAAICGLLRRSRLCHSFIRSGSATPVAQDEFGEWPPAPRPSW